MLKKRSFSTLFSALMLINGCAMMQQLHAEDEWKFTLKNAYIDRNFDQSNVKDTGSWSQGASLFYTSKFHDTPLQILDQPIQIGVDGSVQYAVRLSNDKHVDDTVLPFDPIKKEQSDDYLKYSGTLKPN